jgi:hypothetical protein
MDPLSELIMRGLASMTAQTPMTGTVRGTLPPDPAYGPSRPAMGGYMASPMPALPVEPPMKPMAPVNLPPQSAPAPGAAPAGLLSAPPSPGAAPPAGTPQPISPLFGAPQAVSPLVGGGALPELPSGGLAAGQEDRGFLDFLAQPELARGLMEMGAKMLAASAPSTDPRSGSLGYALGQGVSGLQGGMDAAKEEQRQKRLDAVNEAYKLAIAGSGGNPAPETIKVATPDGLGEQTLQWNSGTSQWEPIAGAGAKPYKASGSGAGGPGGPGKWSLKTVNGQSMWVNETTQEMRPVSGAAAPAGQAELLGEVDHLLGLLEKDPNVVGFSGSLLGNNANWVGATFFGGDRYANQRQFEMFTSERAMELAKQLKGNLSDKDVKWLKDTQPKLSDPPELWQRWLGEFKTRFGAAAPAPMQQAPGAGSPEPPPGFVPVN